MKKLAVTLLLLALAAAASAQTPAVDIEAVLRDAEAGWNAGDIERYMQSYWNSPDLCFAGGATVTRGWQTTLDRYRTRYPARAAMGTLAFTDLEITMLGPDAAMAFGRWELARAGDRPHGLFTLIIRRLPEGWRIVHDHTSSAD